MRQPGLRQRLNVVCWIWECPLKARSLEGLTDAHFCEGHGPSIETFSKATSLTRQQHQVVCCHSQRVPVGILKNQTSGTDDAPERARLQPRRCTYEQTKKTKKEKKRGKAKSARQGAPFIHILHPLLTSITNVMPPSSPLSTTHHGSRR